jgi:recombination protein RecT
MSEVKNDPKKEVAKTGKQPEATTQAVVLQKNIADNVLARVQQFTANKDIRLPSDYSPENALKSAWLILLETKNANKEPVLTNCTKESIANSLLNMVLQGLNPVKKQCDFIAYGDKLTLQREYHGTIALAKRFGGIKEAVGNVIYEGDEFVYSLTPSGYKKIDKHIQSLDNIDMNKIKGAYATLIFEDSKKENYVEIMSITQIRQAWQQGATKGASPAHKNFPDQMSIKTVISRACKLFITSSDDGALYDDAERDEMALMAKQRVKEDANNEEITMDISSEIITDKPETKVTEVKVKEGQKAPSDLFEENKGKPGF